MYLVWMVNRMISDEKTKQNLFLAYKISDLYLKSNVSYVLNLILLFIYIILNRKTINEMINYGLSFIRKKIKTN